MIDVGSTLEGVRTRLRDGVHSTTDEVGLTNIERRDDHLHFLDSIERDGVTTTRKVLCQTEVVIEVGTIDREVGHLTITTSQAHTITTIRRQTHHVGQTTVNGWQVGNHSIVDVGRSTSLFSSKLRSLTTDYNLCQHIGVL